jgi:short-subunit dehydrogenase
MITGGGSGMGQLAARNAANGGATVSIIDINEAGMAKTQEGLINIHSFVANLTEYQTVEDAVQAAIAKSGPVDRFFNCAAIMPFGKLLEHDVTNQKLIMDINYLGLVHVTRAVLPAMVARGSGDFISFASMAGVVPTMLTGAYSASKAAVKMYTEILYHENMNSGVRFACVCPPTVNTPLLDQGRATAWPKMLDSGNKYLSPQDVLSAIDTHLDKGKFWVYPDRDSRIGQLVRRLFPGLIWKEVHKVEGF